MHEPTQMIMAERVAVLQIAHQHIIIFSSLINRGGYELTKVTKTFHEDTFCDRQDWYIEG